VGWAGRTKVLLVRVQPVTKRSDELYVPVTDGDVGARRHSKQCRQNTRHDRLVRTTHKSYGTMRHVRSGKNTHCRRVRNRRNFAHFPSGTESMGDRGCKKARTDPRTGIYLPTKFGCDRSIVVGCRSRNDRQTSRQTDKQNGMTIRLTLCERDATDTGQTYAD